IILSTIKVTRRSVAGRALVHWRWEKTSGPAGGRGTPKPNAGCTRLTAVSSRIRRPIRAGSELCVYAHEDFREGRICVFGGSGAGAKSAGVVVRAYSRDIPGIRDS